MLRRGGRGREPRGDRNHGAIPRKIALRAVAPTSIGEGARPAGSRPAARPAKVRHTVCCDAAMKDRSYSLAIVLGLMILFAVAVGLIT
jgi:hypothetical protein